MIAPEELTPIPEDIRELTWLERVGLAVGIAVGCVWVTCRRFKDARKRRAAIVAWRRWGLR